MTRQPQGDFSPHMPGIVARGNLDIDRAANHARELRARYLQRTAKLVVRAVKRAAPRNAAVIARWLRAGVAGVYAGRRVTLVRR